MPTTLARRHGICYRLEVEAVEAARGYCNVHSWQLRVRSGAALGTALMYRDVLQHVAGESGRPSAGAHRAIFATGRGDGGLRDRLAGLAGSSGGNGKGRGIT